MERFVSVEGDDLRPGSESQPFRTITRALQEGVAGTTSTLRGGVYLEEVKIVDVHGAKPQDKRIVVRSAPGERAFIDSGVQQLRSAENSDWEPAAELGAHPNEFISVANSLLLGSTLSIAAPFWMRIRTRV